MTRQAKYNIQCSKCQIDLVCPKCRETKKHGSEFSKWLRKLGITDREFSSSFLVIHNLDFICFWYRQHWFITIEEKTHGAIPTRSQRNTQNVVAQLLEIASRETVETINGPKSIEYKGHYYVSFENSTPDDSAWVKLNGERHYQTRNAIIWLLKYGRICEDSKAKR